MLRALNPWPGVWLEHHGQKIKLLQGTIVQRNTEAPFGTFLNKEGDMTTANGIMRITKIQTPSGKQMDVASAIHGGIIQCV